MHPRVLETFRSMQSRDEGTIRYMYRDANGHVTTGIGFLMRTIDQVDRYRWVNRAGGAVDNAIARREWQEVHDHQRDRSAVLLHPAELNSRFERAARTLEAQLSRAFPLWPVYPADAQLGMLIHAYAFGGDRDNLIAEHPNYYQACRQQNWLRAREEVIWRALREARPQHERRVRRRDALRLLFYNANRVREAMLLGGEYAFGHLYYPGLAPEPPSALGRSLSTPGRRPDLQTIRRRRTVMRRRPYYERNLP
jgi:hypothetical protein